MTAARELVVAGARVLTDIGADPARKDILVKGNKIAAITAPGETGTTRSRLSTAVASW